MGNQTFIEINGKKYDAVTGRLLAEQPLTAQKTVIKPHNSGNVDGFSRRIASKLSRKHAPAQHLQKTPQRSQTLMRTAVKKPQPLPAKSPSLLRPSLKTPAHRVARAQEVKKSPQIQKYDHSQAARSSVVKRQAELSVRSPQPLDTTHAMSAHAPSSVVSSNHDHRRAASAKMLEAALDNAQTHEHTLVHTKKRRNGIVKKLGISTKTAALSSAVLAGVLLGGFFALQNVPNLSMRVAATRAGFDAHMPGYQPAGFSFNGPINYKPGQVVVSFKSNADERNYSVTQTSSNWNSDALLANFISNEKKQYQTYLDKGRTLYIYDGSNATWVDNGVWYQIEGDSSLTTDQLIRIASSI